MPSIKRKYYQKRKAAQNVSQNQKKNQPIETQLGTTEINVFRQ